MTTIVTIRLHDDGRDSAIDLGLLSARARALAEAVSVCTLRTRGPVVLTSTRTMREMGAGNDPRDALYWDDWDRHHTTVWEAWADYPGSSELDPHDYLEQEARKLPLGYYPSGTRFDPLPSAEAARAEADLIPKAQVLELLRSLGRPISPATLDNYRSRPPAGWPQPARYVGRTPLWSRAALEAYAAAGCRVEAALAAVTEVDDLGPDDMASLAEALGQVARGETAVFASTEEFDADLRAQTDA